MFVMILQYKVTIKVFYSLYSNNLKPHNKYISTKGKPALSYFKYPGGGLRVKIGHHKIGA